MALRAATTGTMRGTARRRSGSRHRIPVPGGDAVPRLSPDFGIIGGVGMACCWLSAYTVLPAGLVVLERLGWIEVPS